MKDGGAELTALGPIWCHCVQGLCPVIHSGGFAFLYQRSLVIRRCERELLLQTSHGWCYSQRYDQRSSSCEDAFVNGDAVGVSLQVRSARVVAYLPFFLTVQLPIICSLVLEASVSANMLSALSSLGVATLCFFIPTMLACILVCYKQRSSPAPVAWFLLVLVCLSKTI